MATYSQDFEGGTTDSWTSFGTLTNISSGALAGTRSLQSAATSDGGGGDMKRLVSLSFATGRYMECSMLAKISGTAGGSVSLTLQTESIGNAIQETISQSFTFVDGATQFISVAGYWQGTGSPAQVRISLAGPGGGLGPGLLIIDSVFASDQEMEPMLKRHAMANLIRRGNALRM